MAGGWLPNSLQRGPIESYASAQWFPDSKALLITAREPARDVRMYRQSIEGGPPAPITPEGVAGLLSPKGDRVVTKDSTSGWLLFPLDGSPPAAAPGMEALDVAVAFSPEGDAVFVRRGSPVPRGSGDRRPHGSPGDRPSGAGRSAGGLDEQRRLRPGPWLRVRIPPDPVAAVPREGTLIS
jgi:hypothetical protein